MKGGREHRVPLSADALAVLNKVGKGDPEDFVFAGRKNRPLSNMALLMLLRRMGHNKLTAHGFRSTFRDWAAERTNFSSEVAEMALAHSIGDKVEAAYRRGDLFEKRRQLMAEWAKFCTGGKSAATVVSIGSRQR
jgi:integrase